MDFRDIISNCIDQDNGAELVLVDPVTGEPTDMKLIIAGPDSATQRRARLAMVDELAELADEDGKVSAENREKASIAMLARAVLRWDIRLDGEALPFEHQNVVRLLSTGTWVREQVDGFAGSRRPYARRA